MASKCVLVSAVVAGAVLLGGPEIVPAKPKTTLPAREETRTISCSQIEKAPLIDGKLDDACWQKAEPVTDFLAIDSDRLATYQSIGYVCYDDTHLYISMKCLMPKGVTPGVEKGSAPKKPHDSYLFSDDIVEVMFDPGRSRSDFYQLAVNAYGSTYDTHRLGGGTQHDPTWNGDWTAATSIGDGYWTMEMSVPYSTLGVSPQVGSTWGINLCREVKMPNDEYSSIATRGAFNNAKKFAALKGLNADFSKYFQIGPALTRLDLTTDKLAATYSIPVRNTSSEAKQVKIDRSYTDSDGKDQIESMVVDLGPNDATGFAAERLDVAPLSLGRTDAYAIHSTPATKKIVVTDAKDGTILGTSFVKQPSYCEAMRIEVQDPWQKNMPEQSPSVSLKVITLLSTEQLRDGELVVTLRSKDSSQVLASQKFLGPSETSEVVFPAKGLSWGAFEVQAVFKGSNGQEIISCRTNAMVLPGDKHRIQVLNNMVSELMNAKERRLLSEKELEFMNPREGWVCISLAGTGRAMLDSDSKPLSVARVDEEASETMRRLKAGRHKLHLEGEFQQIIVRAVPELIYSCHPSMFEWKFLRSEVLPHCNTILGGTNDQPAMREWAEEGKKWVTFAVAPGHGLGGETFIPAERYYETLTAHEGFTNPLLSGAMVDQIAAASPKQKMAFASALGRIAANSEFQSKVFTPWYEGVLFGSDADSAYMKLVLEAGWPFSYYYYLTEKATEEQVLADIDDLILGIGLGGEAQIPGSIRRAIVTLGYWSDVSTGHFLDIDPAVNFKVLMQMQFEALAKEPAFFGVYGAFWYYSPYVDEEILRWSSQLYRHYGIEGKTSKLTTDPYRLTHIVNPDFEQGTEGWTLEASEPGAINPKTLPNYGNFQGRFIGGSRGDTFLVTKRSKNGPNKFSQEIKDLVPGRTYSVKMITADYGNILAEKSVKQQDAVSIELDNVDPVNVPGKNVQTTYPNHYGHPMSSFRGDHPGYLNYHWHVFRAKGQTATLTISDWATPNEAGGAADQQTIFNFIQIEPYFEATK